MHATPIGDNDKEVLSNSGFLDAVECIKVHKIILLSIPTIEKYSKVQNELSNKLKSSYILYTILLSIGGLFYEK